MSASFCPYMVFNGSCAEAAEFYRSAFQGELNIMRFKDAPPNPEFPLSKLMAEKVLHAEIIADGLRIMMSDTFDEMQEHDSRCDHMCYAVMLDSVEQTTRVFGALSEGGKVTMPLQQTFYSSCYGACTDKYNVNWQIACNK